MADQPISADPLITDPAFIDRIPVTSAGINKAISYPDFVSGLVAANISDFDAEVSDNVDVSASKTKTDFLTVTQAVNLDTIESDTAASKTKTDFITVTQAVDLDVMESDIAANTPLNGTFTPTLQDTSFSDAEGQTYFTQVGHYQKVGDWIHGKLRIEMNSLGTLTAGSQAFIAGLPFLSDSTAQSYASVTCGHGQGLSITAAASVSGFIELNTSKIALNEWNVTGGTSALLVSEFTATGAVMLSFSYKIN